MIVVRGCLEGQEVVSLEAVVLSYCDSGHGWFFIVGGSGDVLTSWG